MRNKVDIAVIGGGVSGLTTALSLAKAGYKTTVVSKDHYSGATTSIAAAALWVPYKAEPKEKVAAWALRTLEVFRGMQAVKETGVVWHQFSELLLPETDWPWWRDAVDDFKCNEKIVELPCGKRKICYYKIPIIDTGFYLKYLEQSLKALEVDFIMSELSSVDEAFAIGNTVVNCAGIGARALVEDQDLHPARGQIVRIKRQPHHIAIVDASQEPKLAHVTPRINDTVLGGTYEDGVFSLEPDAAVTKEIIKRCQAIFPLLGDITEADIVSVACGLRPVRSSVRVEYEPHSKGKLFHNYGHGGAGFTLSWGCAEEIGNLMTASKN